MFKKSYVFLVLVFGWTCWGAVRHISLIKKLSLICFNLKFIVSRTSQMKSLLSEQRASSISILAGSMSILIWLQWSVNGLLGSFGFQRERLLLTSNFVEHHPWTFSQPKPSFV